MTASLSLPLAPRRRRTRANARRVVAADLSPPLSPLAPSSPSAPPPRRAAPRSRAPEPSWNRKEPWKRKDCLPSPEPPWDMKGSVESQDCLALSRLLRRAPSSHSSAPERGSVTLVGARPRRSRAIDSYSPRSRGGHRRRRLLTRQPSVPSSPHPHARHSLAASPRAPRSPPPRARHDPRRLLPRARHDPRRLPHRRDHREPVVLVQRRAALARARRAARRARRRGRAAPPRARARDAAPERPRNGVLSHKGLVS